MSIATFIPTIWSARLLANLDNNHVATNFVNRDYEGEIKQKGDKVKINSVGEITIGDYTGAKIGDPETLTTSDQELEINQGKFFNFSVDDVDKVQAAGPLMDKAMQRAAFGLSDVNDKFIFTTIEAGATALSSTAIALTASNVYETLVSIRTLMDKNNVPMTGRKVAVPPEAYALLLLDDRFVKTGGTNAEATLKNGLVGEVAGFQVFESNNLPFKAGTGSGDSAKPAETTIIAGHDMGGTYAEQIVQTEAYRPEQFFADAVKGLQVYGAKATMPKCYVKVQATFA
ncbi:P22 phage major capsid protein family protein [Eubacterium sp.]|uniref:P22 phage major capsid protein family protein n=1 Tax=Eubacterium sp. TaxID=142586 RepID=UPI0026DEEF19|nr:P22 phage major capsid protein family protein [Eubacterium sp.]MDO5432973.1 P22 coat protein - protein 5 domain protein [Eubacterium sp.]